jgi:hypothetical protein
VRAAHSVARTACAAACANCTGASAHGQGSARACACASASASTRAAAANPGTRLRNTPRKPGRAREPGRGTGLRQCAARGGACWASAGSALSVVAIGAFADSVAGRRRVVVSRASQARRAHRDDEPRKTAEMAVFELPIRHGSAGRLR